MEDGRISGRAWLMLGLLCALYILSFVDRFILALLVAPLRAEMGLSDVQVGLLFGTVFALFYAIPSLPLARFADRANRKWLIIAGVVVWCFCTIGSGLAQNYATLAILRFGLAIGEAALTPAAFSLLTDSFPPHRRTTATTLFSAAGMMGAAGSFAMGAAVIAAAEPVAADWGISAWRLTFVAVGVPGLVVAAIFAVVAHEPARDQPGAKPPPLREVGAYLLQRSRFYGGLFGGAGAAQTLGYAMIAWSPAYLDRAFGLSGPAAGAQLSAAQLVSAVGGTLMVPTLIRHLSARRPRAASAIPMISALAGALLVAVGTQLPSAAGYLTLMAAGSFLLIGSTNSVIILIQPIAPPAMRATFTALLLVCISSIGMGIGPPAVAALAQRAGNDPAALGHGLVIVALLVSVVATILFGLAMRPLAEALRQLASAEDHSQPQVAVSTEKGLPA